MSRAFSYLEAYGTQIGPKSGVSMVCQVRSERPKEEGEALKALFPYCAGSVKCIYIDPAYNTGSTYNGWVLDRISGSHHVMVKDGCRSIPVPVHGSKDLGVWAQKILKEAGIKR